MAYPSYGAIDIYALLNYKLHHYIKLATYCFFSSSNENIDRSWFFCIPIFYTSGQSNFTMHFKGKLTKKKKNITPSHLIRQSNRTGTNCH